MASRVKDFIRQIRRAELIPRRAELSPFLCAVCKNHGLTYSVIQQTHLSVGCALPLPTTGQRPLSSFLLVPTPVGVGCKMNPASCFM